MRIKFIKIEEGLEGRGKKATGKVSRAVTGHVVTPRGGKVGVDDNPAKPTKKLKAMVRRSYKAKAENSSTEILGNKIVEGFNDLLEVTAKGVAAAAIGQARRGGGSVESGYLPGSNFITVKRPKGNTHVLAKRGGKGGTYVSKKMRSGKTRIRSIPDSTEISGDRIPEATAKGVSDAAKKRKGSFTKTGYNPRTGRNEDITSVPGRRSRTTVADVEGGVMVGREGPKGYRTRKVNASTEILGNKIVESFNGLLDRVDELSHKLKMRAAKAAKKKAKEHAKIASAAGKVKARDTEVVHDKISRSKQAQADRFAGKAGGEDKKGKREYHQAKKEAGIGSRRVPVAKR